MSYYHTSTLVIAGTAIAVSAFAVGFLSAKLLKKRNSNESGKQSPAFCTKRLLRMLRSVMKLWFIPHILVLSTAGILILLFWGMDSGIGGAFLGTAIGSFTLRDPLALFSCLVLGLLWRWWHIALIASLICLNIACRVWVYYDVVLENARLLGIEVHLTAFKLIATSYGALIVGYTANFISRAAVKLGKAVWRWAET